MPRPVIPITAPYTPELLPIAQYAIERLLNEDDSVFEYGSGHSTLWLAGLCENVIAVEHDPSWYVAVIEGLGAHGPGVGVYLVDEKEIADTIAYGVFDLVIVDCLDRQRVNAVRAAMPHVRPGGYLVLDDSHWPMLQPAHDLLIDWHRTTVSGQHTRKNGDIRYHETSFYQRPVNHEDV